MVVTLKSTSEGEQDSRRNTYSSHPVATARPSCVLGWCKGDWHLWEPEEDLRSSSQDWLFPLEVTQMQ